MGIEMTVPLCRRLATPVGRAGVGLVMWSLSLFIIFMVRIGRVCRRWFRIFGSCGGGVRLLLR